MIVSQYWTQRLLTCSPNSVVIHQDLMLLHASTTASHWLYHLTTSICFNQAWTLSHIISSSVSIKETQCIDTDYNCGFIIYQSGNHIQSATPSRRYLKKNPSFFRGADAKNTVTSHKIPARSQRRPRGAERIGKSSVDSSTAIDFPAHLLPVSLPIGSVPRL